MAVAGPHFCPAIYNLQMDYVYVFWSVYDMTELRSDICCCRCHTSRGFMQHIMPCCVTCSHCGQHIQYGAWDEHQLRCGELYNSMNEKKIEKDEAGD